MGAIEVAGNLVKASRLLPAVELAKKIFQRETGKYATLAGLGILPTNFP